MSRLFSRQPQSHAYFCVHKYKFQECFMCVSVYICMFAYLISHVILITSSWYTPCRDSLCMVLWRIKGKSEKEEKVTFN